MTKNKPAHTIQPFPLSRQIVIDFNRIGRSKNSIRGLVEFDVTKPRNILSEYKQNADKSISFTAFICHCLGKAVDKHKQVHAYRGRRDQIIIFDEVDVATVIEIEFQNARFPMSHIVRAANKRSVQKIHDEIRAVQKNSDRSESKSHWKTAKWLLRLPWPLRRAFYLSIKRNPFKYKAYSGTVSLSAVGMYATGISGWGFGNQNHTLGIALGGIAKKPRVVNDKVEPGEILNVTIDIDHDIVDGAPATEFAQTFRELVESGSGLENFT